MIKVRKTVIKDQQIAFQNELAMRFTKCYRISSTIESIFKNELGIKPENIYGNVDFG
jgi:hypothetical protein